MTANGWFQILFFLLVLLAVTKPLGVFMTRVFTGRKRFSTRCCARSNGCSIG